ncbi:hypothetical protein HWV62_1360 [Athelia sp. TMB]|nr:hypothetical protein HWV62_1360 [Athelia sp. TMB]
MRRRRDLVVRPAEGMSLASPMAEPKSELERRVQALQATVVQEDTVQALGGFSEDDLLDIYQDLLALPSPDAMTTTPNELSPVEEDAATVHAVEQRLFGAERSADGELNTGNGSSSLAAALLHRQGASPLLEEAADLNDTPTSDIDVQLGQVQEYHRVLERLQGIVGKVQDAQLRAARGPVQDVLPVSIIADNEWASLVRVCMHEQDVAAAELTVDLMKRSGASISEDSINRVLAFYAERGDVSGVENFMTNALTLSPTESQRDLHVKAYLRAAAPKTIPERALTVLHNYELQSKPAPMATYTRLITALFSVPSSIGHAQAWDLFTHMRYVAHPNPDAQLYTQMIRACASSLVSSAEPERALDLWTEMTVDHGLAPSTGTYTAVILACARSGTKTYVHEAFRLAKEMLDSHRDALGRAAYKPDGKTFCALLEGAKRIGDLARARWILAEMVKGDEKGADESFVDAHITEEVMMHVFHAYASYNVPFKRTAAPLSQQESSSAEQEASSADAAPADVPQSQSPGDIAQQPDIPSFTHLPPQSRAEVLGEVRALFGRILDDTHAVDAPFASDNPAGKFSHVQLTPRLVNSYLSVYYKHGSLEECRRLFWSLFEELGVKRNVRSFVEGLERCANAKRGTERTESLAFAEELYAQWVLLERGEHPSVQEPVSARMIERANIAAIRLWTLCGDLDRAVAQVKSFTDRYPPIVVNNAPIKLPFQSTRTVLLGARPLVRMTPATELPDDTVPPILTFPDIELLHHRLVAMGKKKEIGFLKWTCKAYEGSLRARRDATMRAEPPKA